MRGWMHDGDETWWLTAQVGEAQEKAAAAMTTSALPGLVTWGLVVQEADLSDNPRELFDVPDLAASIAEVLATRPEVRDQLLCLLGVAPPQTTGAHVLEVQDGDVLLLPAHPGPARNSVLDEAGDAIRAALGVSPVLIVWSATSVSTILRRPRR